MPPLPLSLDALAATLLALSVKGSLLLVLALGAALCLRRGAAAHRHAVWMAALSALLVLPLAGALLPGWYASAPAPRVVEAVLPAWVPAEPAGAGLAWPTEGEEVVAPVAAEAPAAAGAVRGRAEAALASGVAAGRAQVERAAGFLASYGWAMAGLAWLLGVVGLALRWGGALLGASRIVEDARPVTDEAWQAAARSAARMQGVHGEVRLLRSDRLSVPVAWTLGRPAVVLPADADEWAAERRRVVLAHEMSHVARRDGLTQLVAQAAVLLHWFNPLAWFAYHRVLEEREQACDDRVLLRGARPSAYAQHLVELARRYRQEPLAVLALAPMARPSGLEARVRSILDPSPRRATASRGVVAGTALAALALTLPLAAFQPAPPPSPLPPPPRRLPSPRRRSRPLPPRPPRPPPRRP